VEPQSALKIRKRLMKNLRAVLKEARLMIIQKELAHLEKQRRLQIKQSGTIREEKGMD
jgi:hypothetical protein